MKIALIGLSGVGKTTFNHTMQIKLGLFRLSLANELKKDARKILNLDSALDSQESKRKVFPNGKTVRDFLQEYGTELVRSYNPDYWINLVVDSHNRGLTSPDYKGFVIDDVRFDNEYTKLKELGFTFVSLERNNHLKWLKVLITILGHNEITRFIVRLIDRKYAHESEWNYFSLKNKCDLSIMLPNEYSLDKHEVLIRQLYQIIKVKDEKTN